MKKHKSRLKLHLWKYSGVHRTWPNRCWSTKDTFQLVLCFRHHFIISDTASKAPGHWLSVSGDFEMIPSMQIFMMPRGWIPLILVSPLLYLFASSTIRTQFWTFYHRLDRLWLPHENIWFQHSSSLRIYCNSSPKFSFYFTIIRSIFFITSGFHQLLEVFPSKC